jgi:hypothetical protein
MRQAMDVIAGPLPAHHAALVIMTREPAVSGRKLTGLLIF